MSYKKEMEEFERNLKAARERVRINIFSDFFDFLVYSLECSFLE